MSAQLQSIFTAAQAGAPMRSHDVIMALAGQGLAGDRYALGEGTFSQREAIAPGARELSLIEAEAVAECNRRLGSELTAADCRRNLLTTGLPLMTLAGRQLRIGEVLIEIVSTCPPCGYLSRVLNCDTQQGLKGMGGMRARILAGGELQAGMEIQLL